jgi:hypothetical protein
VGLITLVGYGTNVIFLKTHLLPLLLFYFVSTIRPISHEESYIMFKLIHAFLLVQKDEISPKGFKLGGNVVIEKTHFNLA